jgi:RNA recognition motif-containing protein
MSAAVETATPNEGAAAPTENTNAAQSPEVIASAAEGTNTGTCDYNVEQSSQFAGRRLYIGNLAYATNEGELKTFFKEFLV